MRQRLSRAILAGGLGWAGLLLRDTCTCPMCRIRGLGENQPGQRWERRRIVPSEVVNLVCLNSGHFEKRGHAISVGGFGWVQGSLLRFRLCARMRPVLNEGHQGRAVFKQSTSSRDRSIAMAGWVTPTSLHST